MDAAVRALVEEAHGRAREILVRRRSALEALAALLQQKEVINGEEAAEILRREGFLDKDVSAGA